MPQTAKQILTKARLHKSHWGKRIIAAEKRGGFTDKVFYDAMSWTTCACGKQSAKIPRLATGHPLDNPLRSLGGKFAAEVSANGYPAAARILIAIEKRAAIVLRQTLKAAKK